MRIRSSFLFLSVTCQKRCKRENLLRGMGGSLTPPLHREVGGAQGLAPELRTIYGPKDNVRSYGILLGLGTQASMPALTYSCSR